MKRIIHQMNMLLCILPFRWWMEVLNDEAHPCFTLLKFISSFFFCCCIKLTKGEGINVCIFLLLIDVWCFFLIQEAQLSKPHIFNQNLCFGQINHGSEYEKNIGSNRPLNGRQMNWIEHWKYM